MEQGPSEDMGVASPRGGLLPSWEEHSVFVLAQLSDRVAKL